MLSKIVACRHVYKIHCFLQIDKKQCLFVCLCNLYAAQSDSWMCCLVANSAPSISAFVWYHTERSGALSTPSCILYHLGRWGKSYFALSFIFCKKNQVVLLCNNRRLHTDTDTVSSNWHWVSRISDIDSGFSQYFYLIVFQQTSLELNLLHTKFVLSTSQTIAVHYLYCYRTVQVLLHSWFVCVVLIEVVAACRNHPQTWRLKHILKCSFVN